jgi:hypothetical protein
MLASKLIFLKFKLALSKLSIMIACGIFPTENVTLIAAGE